METTIMGSISGIDYGAYGDPIIIYPKSYSIY